jgi:hypothetical protein
VSPIVLVLLALLAGALVGGVASRAHRPPDGHERRSMATRAVRPVARVVSAFVEPAFHWLGLLDPQGNPDNSKITYSAVIYGSLYLTIHIGREITAVTWPFIGLVCAVILGSAGPRILLKGLRVWKPSAYRDDEAEPAKPGAP